jgi:hypothetical protein
MATSKCDLIFIKINILFVLKSLIVFNVLPRSGSGLAFIFKAGYESAFT